MRFKFYSVFQWTPRKGYEVLFRAFLEEFTAEDPVVLCILTHLHHRMADFDSMLMGYAATLPSLQNKTLPMVHFLQAEMPEDDMPCLYKAMDVFVLPSKSVDLPNSFALSLRFAVISLLTRVFCA